ncbi:hypothetical protein L2E82_47792 [Cichorium intybus]|uniref:Uncharacterized protein n=1 Tax=Cichorium intybus TaxID=13427 RepID=A0ACB8YWC3_CICIN|nr:hypothetical protein L2E82_47792 [Cichorium intybus]
MNLAEIIMAISVRPSFLQETDQCLQMKENKILIFHSFNALFRHKSIHSSVHLPRLIGFKTKPPTQFSFGHNFT